jgi:hypothetical protein
MRMNDVYWQSTDLIMDAGGKEVKEKEQSAEGRTDVGRNTPSCAYEPQQGPRGKS